jgi:hypothetical protein
MNRALWLSIAAASTACSEPDLTQIVVRIEADEEVQRAATHLSVRVVNDPEDTQQTLLENSKAPWRDGAYTVAISPEKWTSRGRYAVEASALKNGKPVAEARLLAGYVPGETRYVRLALEGACIDVLDCDVQSTCRGGTCVGASVDAADFARTQTAAPASTALAAAENPEPASNDDAGAADATPVKASAEPAPPMLAPTDPTAPTTRGDATSLDKVDLLLMVDNSGSMGQEQAKLGATLERMVGALLSGNRDYPLPPRSAGETFPPVSSLHIGVITSTLGSPAGVVALGSPLCLPDNGVSNGGGGILQANGLIASQNQVDPNSGVQVKAGVPACSNIRMVPNYLAFGTSAAEIDHTDSHMLNDGIFRFGCIATVGTGGCGIEQQLEATWKALAPDSVDDFVGPDIRGQGNRKNAGFLRDDSILTVLMVSDEDDCSVTSAGQRMFERDIEPYVGVRCQLQKELPSVLGREVHLVQRYVDGFMDLRKDHPERFVFAAVVGLPLLSALYTDPAALLAHPTMQMQLDPTSNGKDLVGVCGSEASGGKAYPGRRFVELADGIGKRGGSYVLSSICTNDYTPVVDSIVEKVAAVVMAGKP